MSVVLFLIHLFASDVELRTVCYDYVVAAVSGWVVDGFVFTH